MHVVGYPTQEETKLLITMKYVDFDGKYYAHNWNTFFGIYKNFFGIYKKAPLKSFHRKVESIEYLKEMYWDRCYQVTDCVEEKYIWWL